MNINQGIITTNYQAQIAKLPKKGKHIVGQFDEDSIIVYQAFNPRIARYAVDNQQFGGSHYNLKRMTWIKPNFLWMMYRAGWAQKENQERILAISLKKSFFLKILNLAVHSSFQAHIYETQENWKHHLANSDVRLQWDPTHDPFGEKLVRKAIQLGIRGNIFLEFNSEGILHIEDITPFVQDEFKKVKAKDLINLVVPKEAVFPIESEEILKRLGMS